MLKHDAQGFLLGEPLNLGRAFEVLAAIRADVRAIKNAVLDFKTPILPAGNVANIEKAANDPVLPALPVFPAPLSKSLEALKSRDLPSPQSPQKITVTPRLAAQKAHKIDALAPMDAPMLPELSLKLAPLPAAPDVNLTENLPKESSTANTPKHAPEHTPKQTSKTKPSETKSQAHKGRDENGRFVKKEDQPSEANGLKGFADRLLSLLKDSSQDAEQADPAIAAFNEIAQPLSRGLELFGGGEDKKQTKLLRRIANRFQDFFSENKAFNKAAQKSLKNIEDKPTESQEQGGFLASLLSFLPMFLTGFKAMFSKLPLFGGGKAWLSRLPVLGSILTAGSALWDIFNIDPNLDQRSKDKQTGKAIGKAGGMLAGAGAGAALGSFLGPLGTIAGGIIGAYLGENAGEIIGEQIGAWVNDLRQIDFAALIREPWDKITASFSSLPPRLEKYWDKAIAKISAFFDQIKAIFSRFWEALKSVPWLGDAISKSENVAKNLSATVKAQAARASRAVGQGFASAKAWVSEGVDDAKQVIFGNTESPKGLSKLGKRYRQKHSFDGISGGQNLQKYGTYTEAEAAKIRHLKQSRAKTGASGMGGMSVEIQDKITAHAQKHGLDPLMMQKIAAMESGGNANAISSTGAIGIYQFVGKTATGVGISDRFNADQNIEGGMILAKQNATFLQKRGLPVTTENLYMAHQLGAGAAAEMIRGAQTGKTLAQMSSSTREAISHNYGRGVKTAAQYIAANKKALDDRYRLVTHGTRRAMPENALPAPAATGNSTPPMMPSQASIAPNAAPKTGGHLPSFDLPNLNLKSWLTPPLPPQVSSLSAPSIKTSFHIPMPQSAPAVQAPMSHAPKAKPSPSMVQDVGQDVRDRSIAHIATGGIGGR